ncbi:hypothetical protein ACFQFG_05590 [Methylobacterium persicinum]
MRLDTLIGTYVDPNGQADPYTSYVDGASHRVSADAVLKGGLLAAASTGGITFAAHFTDLLKSGAYKDYVLGDGAPNGGNDTALYTGSLAKYTLVAIDANGQTIANPHANWGSVAAFKITDTRTAADFVDANGNPCSTQRGPRWSTRAPTSSSASRTSPSPTRRSTFRPILTRRRRWI